MAVDTALRILALVTLIYVLWVKLHKVYRNGSYGPRSYPLVGCTISYLKNRSRLCDWYTELLRDSPTQTITVQRLGGVTTVVTANPENVEHILQTRFGNYPKGQIFKGLLQDLLGDGIFNVDGENWRIQRKIACYEFNTRSLRNFIVECVQSETSERLTPLLRHASKVGGYIDLQDVLRRLSFDNICKVAFGMDPNCLEISLPQSEFAKAFDLACQLSSKRARSVIPFVWRVKRALNLGSEKALAQALRVVHEFASEIIHRRKAELELNLSPQSKPDLLSRFMPLTEDIDENFLRDIIISFVLAGRDTTASALTWFFWLLSSHPNVEQSILREVTAVVSKREKAYDENPAVTFSYEEVKGMQYLHAAICESMRLYPPVRYDSKHALEDDVLPDGTFVQKGNWVTYHPYAMGRMESVWGEDCMEFRPERWLKEDSFVPESPFKYAVFQAGVRICLGKEMAFIQMKYVAASLIHDFRFRPDPRRNPEFVPSLTSTMKNGLSVLVEIRPSPHLVPS